MTEDNSSPVRLWQFEDKHQISFDDFELAWEIFEEAGYDSGGYAWHGAMEALLRLKAPALLKKVEFDPEASLFSAYSKDKDAIEQLADWMRHALEDPALLGEAIANADPELMD